MYSSCEWWKTPFQDASASARTRRDAGGPFSAPAVTSQVETRQPGPNLSSLPRLLVQSDPRRAETAQGHVQNYNHLVVIKSLPAIREAFNIALLNVNSLQSRYLFLPKFYPLNDLKFYLIRESRPERILIHVWRFHRAVSVPSDF